MASKQICKVCKRNTAPYTCPKCNLLYCSLDCFRSPVHVSCSEPFYKETLLSEIQSSGETSRDEKRAMMEILQRLESQDLENDQEEESDEEANADLLEKLKNANIDELNAEELLALLSPQEQAIFHEMVQDPEKVREMLDQELELEPPWWDNEDSKRPEMLSATTLPAVPPAKVDLRYNLLCIVLAYSFLIRRNSQPWDITSSHELHHLHCQMIQLLPFLFDAKSTTQLKSISEAEQYLSKVIEDTDAMAIRELLLEDAKSLLRVKRVTEHSDSRLEASASSEVLLVLSDLHALLSARPKKEARSDEMQQSAKKARTGAPKVLFYAAQILNAENSFSREELQDLHARIEETVAKRKSEHQQLDQEKTDISWLHSLDTKPLSSNSTTKIVEIQ